MSVQTLPRVGDRIRVLSVESVVLRIYVGRLGTVCKPLQIPSGAQDKIFVQLDKARKQKPVSLFLKPEDLTTDIDSPIPTDVTKTEGSGRQCNQDSCESSGDAMFVCQIDSQPLTCTVELAQGFHSECLSPVDSDSLDSVKSTSSAPTGYETDFQESRSTQTCDRSDWDFHQSMSLASQPPVSRLAMTGSAEEQKTSEIFSPTALQQSEQLDRDCSALKMFQDSSAARSDRETSQGVSLSSYSGTFPAAGTMQNGFVSAQETLVVPSLDADCCWLESPGALSSDTSRAPGLSKSEGKWQKSGLLKKGEVANPDFLEDCFGLPKGWTSPQESRQAQELLEQGDKSSETVLIGESQRSPSEESSTSTPSSVESQELIPESVNNYPADQTTSGLLLLTQIKVNGGTQSRAELNPSVIEDYAEAMRSGATFPPVTVYYDGEQYLLADGFHRVQAAARADIETIAADIRQGTRRDAVLHSVGANACHGLRRTNADKKRAVETLLLDEEWGQWSDNAIAIACGVSHPFVGKLRTEIFPSCNGYKIERTVQRSGTVYTQNTANIGGKTAVGTQEPAASSQTSIHLLQSSAVPALKERDRVQVVGHPVLAGQRGTITGRPSTVAAIVALDEGERERILVGQLQLEERLPQDLVSLPKSKDKQIMPDVDRNGDIPKGAETPVPAALVNRAAIANGNPDVVATEIAIGIRHLSCEQLAWVISSAASNGLSDDCLRSVIKAGKQALNERHHPEYFNKPVADRSRIQRRKDAHKAEMVDWDEADAEDLTLGVPALDWEPDGLDTES